MAQQVLIAKYTSENYFKVPVGIDLEDKKVIKSYGVKWNILTISFVDENKEDLKIECYQEVGNIEGEEGEVDYIFIFLSSFFFFNITNFSFFSFSFFFFNITNFLITMIFVIFLNKIFKNQKLF